MAWWTIKTYYKKQVEQHEYFYNREIDGAKICVKDAFRSAEYNVETTDDNPPEIKFSACPGGSADLDSIDLNSCFGVNVENTELIEMFDGGQWGDIKIVGIDDEDEVARLTKLIEDEGSYALEDGGDWYLSDTEVWVWGPLEISNDDGYHKIVVADDKGNMVDFVEE